MAIVSGRMACLALCEALGMPSKNILDVKVNVERDEIVSATFTVAIEPEQFSKFGAILQNQQDEYKRAKAQA
jgi:hypothetical protein